MANKILENQDIGQLDKQNGRQRVMTGHNICQCSCVEQRVIGYARDGGGVIKNKKKPKNQLEGRQNIRHRITNTKYV